MHKALLTTPLEDQNVQCQVCRRRCRVSPGKCGFCNTRKNVKGELYSLLEKAREIGMEHGLKYVYLGNMPGHPSENTYCPGCGRLLIRRLNYQILEYQINGNRCRFCREIIAGYFE